MIKRVALCVDDFGLRPAVNEAVAELADAGVISAVGCMSRGPAWRSGVALLRGARREGLDVGLHLNLTETWPGVAAPYAHTLPQVILRSLLRAWPAKMLTDAIEEQLQAFEDVWGCGPDFIDGHQHVHQLPQVRDALLACLARRGAHRPWLRCTLPSPRGAVDVKQRVIALLGGRGLVRDAQAAGLPMNRHLLGVYGFDADAAGYARRLAQWLGQAEDGDLLMMHPAVGGPSSEGAAGDVISAAREVEYEVLSQQGPALLKAQGVQPVRPSLHPPLLRHGWITPS